MKSGTSLAILLFAAFSLAGLIYIQSNWLRKTIQLSELEFERSTRELLSGAAKTNVVFPIPDTSTSDQKSVQKQLIVIYKKAIDSIFHEHNINDPYEFGMMGCCENQLLLVSESRFTEQIRKSKIIFPITGAVNHQHENHMAVYFKSHWQFLIQKLGIELGVSILLMLLLTGLFGYTVIALRKQKKLAMMKNEFVNNMTHEFKTPIASIRLSSRMLKKTLSSPSKNLDYVNLIDNESARLETQVDKILQVALVDSGNFEVDKTSVNIHALIKTVVASFEVAIENARGKIMLDLMAVNECLMADKVHITNMIYNLVDNAIKYSHDHPVIFIATSDSEKGILIRVKDSGIGIRPSSQKQIFDMFYRDPANNESGVKGFGLGLSYVSRIIKSHQGSITVNSELNKGTEFIIHLPVA